MKTLYEVFLILEDHFLILEQEFGLQKIGIVTAVPAEFVSFYKEVNLVVEINNPEGWEYRDIKDYLQYYIGLRLIISREQPILPLVTNCPKKEIIYI